MKEFSFAKCPPQYKIPHRVAQAGLPARNFAVKFLILATICSVIPIFFGLVFLHGTKNRLASLRERCRTAPDSSRAVLEYEAVRTAFPSSLVARWFGFGPVDAAARKNPSNLPRAS